MLSLSFCICAQEEADDEEKDWTLENGEEDGAADLGDGREKEDNTPKNLMKDNQENAAAKTHGR